MQPILVDGGKLVPQGPVEIFNDFGFALHAALPIAVSAGRRLGGWLEQF
jgi:hypothetical protein